MRSRKLGALTVAVVISVVPACSKSGNHRDGTPLAGNGATASPSESASSGPSGAQASGASSSPGGNHGSASPGTGASASASAPGSATPPPRKLAPPAVTLAKMCVTPGSVQTANVKTAPAPKGGDPMIVVYDNLYSDGYDGSKHGG